MMSERGKNWRNPEEPPVSVGDRSVDSDRPTLPAPENHKAGEKITEDPVVQESKSEIEDMRATWRKTKLLSVAWISMILGSTATGYYAYVNNLGPFAPEDETVQTAPPTPSAKEENKEEAPGEIKTEEDLKRAFKKYKIPNVAAQDFDFETKKTEYHAKTMIYKQTIAGNEALKVKDEYAWVRVNNKILKTEESIVLIAVHLISDYARQNAETVVNSGPGAHPYITKMVDEKDPNVIYFYFNKCDNPVNQNALARVRIQHPTNPKKQFWYQSFNMPKCQIETNGVESDEPIQ